MNNDEFSDILALVEQRLAALTKALAKQKAKTEGLEVKYMQTPRWSRTRDALKILARTEKAEHDLAVVAGRQQEAESIWQLLKAHASEENNV